MSLQSPQLDAFMAVAQQKTVHGAAKTLFLTQTAVTQRIRTLERSLKSTLFVRTRRGMQLTPEGEALLRYCHASKALEGETLAKIQGTGTETEVTLCISGPTSMMRARIIPACISVMQDYPNLLIHFDITDNETRHLALRAANADFAIMHPENLTQEMQHKTLKPEHYVLACTPKWKGRRLKEIIQQERIIDFEPNDTMTFNYLKHFNLFEHAQHHRYFANRTESLALLASEGIGYITITKEFAKPYIDSGKLTVMNQGKNLNVEHSLAWYDRPEPAPYFQAIIDAL